MKLTVIPGLIALQLAAALTASAQNYYVKIGGDLGTRVADHASWEQGPINQDESLEAYNIQISGGYNAVGLMRFYSPTGSYSWATHHQSGLRNLVMARRILTPTSGNTVYVAGEQLNASGRVTGAVVLQYDLLNGQLIAAKELATFPLGYTLLRVFDVTAEPGFPDKMRILCLVQNNGIQTVTELLYDAGAGTYGIKKYKPANLAPERYTSAYYIKAYHYSALNLGDIAFYGMASFENESVGYCYAANKFEIYNLSSVKAALGVTGIQMNGSYGGNGLTGRIDMAFTDMDGGLCIQQKDDMNPANWTRSYQVPDVKLALGYGRNGHGTKEGGGMNYFMAATYLSDDVKATGYVTSLHYNTANGDLTKPYRYNMSGIGIQRDGGFPNTTYDPYTNYSFIADRFNQLNGFKLGVSNASTVGNIACTEQTALTELSNKLTERGDDMTVEEFGVYTATPITMKPINDIEVKIIEECNVEQRGTATNGNLLQGGSNLYMDATQLRLEATGKTISAIRVLSIDGRLIAEQHSLNSNRYEQYFNTPLVPGIYVISLVYADHSRENRKISVH
ncbi:hypothetical protein [Taibaiella chishuiensis]|uniref:Secreted protein (Por secretion system target) n=1 Tax=Taibaiella chishuiensis TaxID=1434707 RepID=A0A2P8CX45_9BACT|nr:hypothetical protein [Taibaiella chishuiensis]PSK89530.1 hypothetical protein B0I18_11185 [Taibaiella chishuiensis]